MTASDVLSARPSSESDIAAGSLRLPACRPSSAALSSKSSTSQGLDAFRRPSAPSPCRMVRFRAHPWDHEEPATGLAARVRVAFATCDPASDACSPAMSLALRPCITRARPVVFRPGPGAARRLLQSRQSASTTAGRLVPALPTSPSARAARLPADRSRSSDARTAMPAEVHRPGADRLSTTDAPCTTLAGDGSETRTRPDPLAHLTS